MEQIASRQLVRHSEIMAPVEEVTLRFRREMGKISRQSAVFFTGTLFTAGAGYLFKIYVARVLGAEGMGLYALGMSVVSFFGLFATLGLPYAVSRFVAVYAGTGQVDRLRGLLLRGLVLVVLLSGGLGGLMVVSQGLIAESFFHDPALAVYLPLFALMLPLSTISFFLTQVLVGYQNVARSTIISSFIGTPLSMVLTLGFFALGLELWGYLTAQVVSTIVTLVLMAWAVWRLTPRASRLLAGPLPGLEGGVVSFAASMVGIGILEFLLGQADRVVLGVYLDATQVGIYSVAAATVAFVPILLQSVNSIFGPVIADLHARGERELLSRLFQTLTKWILGLTLPLVMVVVLFAPTLMDLFGPEFKAGWPVLVIGTVGQLVNCGVGSVGFLLLMSGNQNRLIRVQAIMGGLTLIFNLLVIPVWGILGAAIVGALSTAVSNAMYLWEVRRALGLSPYNRGYLHLLGPLVVAGMVTLVMRWLAVGTSWPDWVVMLLALALAYVAFLLGSLAFALDDDDRLIAHSIWMRTRRVLGKAATAMAL